MVGVLTEDVTPKMDRLLRRQRGSDEKQGAEARPNAEIARRFPRQRWR
jgi:hypothetical protein